MKTLKVRTIIDAMLLLAASSYQLYKEDILKKKETMTLQLVAFRPLLERYQNKEFFDHKADPEHADYHANHAMLDGDENYSLYGTSSAILHVLARAHDKHEYTDCFVGVIYMRQSEHLPENIKEMFHSNQNVFTIVLSNRHYRGIFLGFKNHDIQYITISRISSLLAEHEALICTYTISRMRAVTDWGEIFTALTKAVP